MTTVIIQEITPTPVAKSGQQRLIEAEPEVEQLTFAEAFRRFVKTPEDLRLLQRASQNGQRLAVTGGHLMEATQQRRPITAADLKDINAFTRWQEGK